MKYIEIVFESVPTNVPIKLKISVVENQYSEVRLYCSKVDGKPAIVPGKYWYIYYYFRHPLTNKMVKFMDKLNINKFKTVKDRLKVANAWIKAQELILSNGFNPFTAEGLKTKNDKFDFENYTVKTALEYALTNKAGELKTATLNDYKVRVGVFAQWLKENGLEDKNIKELKDVHIIAFMNHLIDPLGRNLGKTSQDNYKRTLSAIFGKLKKDKIIVENIVDYETSKDDPIKNKPFTGEQIKTIKDYLLQNDVQLYHFIMFVIYEFLRPVEIIRLKVENINLAEKTLYVETKTNRKKGKRLIDPIIDFLKGINIENLPQKAHIFTNTGNFEVWEALEKTKVDHFSNRFKKLKAALSLGPEYGVYSFRHTAALDVYNTFIKEGATHQEAVSKLSPIIGHTNAKTTETYLRDVGALLPKDYGEFYTLDF
ncbi:tyrosine-type recombinase/integrase [Flavobacterium capsici]|uniref:Tyrosine-type recombinase/integrase n=1 Tax=Flavobacterium capsici TaxID=3075618 RepID=A0AA96EV92_9FLAO|nr:MULTISPECIES: tyrosine-type recombinase/integrase [unclassified Flavobacterium]WNM19294.1 tyrosine-type recombinase/integrase [Flavobacterium sp. PMR2A8]WNM20683.1 tyrosine-type recombinase/integrase [Flavobacterium sp. PMTSA4]